MFNDTFSSENQKSVKQRGNVIKPDLPRVLFWDYRYDDIEWLVGYRAVITRVLEWGKAEHWIELERFYTRDKIIHTLKSEITYLPNHSIDQVCSYFNLKQEELRCYTRPWWRKGHWPY